MEYKVLQEYTAENLTKAVNEHLQEGWRLHGNLCMAFIAREGGGHLLSFAQAMTQTTGSFFAQDVAESA